VTFDCETYPIETTIKKNTKNENLVLINQHHLSFGFAHCFDLNEFNEYVENKEGYQTDKGFYFENPKDFSEYFLNKIIKSKTLYVLAHNVGYDVRLCYQDDVIKNADFKLKIAISDNAFIYKYVKKNYTITILSTTNYFKTSLKELGKIFNLDKLDFKHDENGQLETKNKTPRALTYCQRDVEILDKVCSNLFYFTKDLCKMSNTIASIAFNTFRYKFYTENIIMHKKPEIEQMERDSYYGGRTECFKIGIFKNIYKLDINSMYSRSMLNHDYPIEFVTKYNENKNNSETNKKILFDLIDRKEYLVIANVKVKLDSRKLPYRKKDTIDKKLLYPIGEFSSFLCQPEIEILDKNEIVEVKEILVYKKYQVFNEFVSHFYDLRLKYKSENNEIMQYFCKTLLNSLYGKFAQKVKKETKNEEYDNFLENGYTDFVDLDGIHSLKFIHGECFEIENVSSGYNTFIPISSFVTSYSRIYLYEMISLVLSYLIYVDTDSLFVSKEGYDILLKNNYIDNKALGKLKLEGILPQLETRNLKDYSAMNLVYVDFFNFRNEFLHDISVVRFEIEHKIKGIKKGAVKKAIKEGENISIKNEWNINRFIGYNESLRYFNLVVGDLNEKKNLKRIYEKGIIGIDGIVQPLTIIEVEDKNILNFEEKNDIDYGTDGINKNIPNPFWNEEKMRGK
jgi:hypothetical protein